MTTIVTRQGKGSALTYEEMDSNLSNLKTDVESTQANVTAANARIQTTDANVGTISTTVTALESNAAGQANQITGANAAIVTANTALKNYVDGQVSTLSANAGSQQTTINTNTADITDLRANITAANAVIATKTTAGYVDSAISTAVNNLINSAPGTLDTLGEIAANLATNADTVGAIVNSITSTNANVTAANAKIATLDANLGSATTNITTLFANAATQSTDISTLSANAASQTTALQVLDANLGTATTNITALQGNAGTQQTTINTHTSQIATLDANLGTATTNITALQGNAGTQQTTINTINANLGAFQTYANVTFGTSSYGNTQATALLAQFGSNSISTTGNVTAGRVNVTTLVTTPEIESLTSLDLNSPAEINVNANLRVGDNNTATQISTHGTGDLILRTHQGSANQGNVRLYNGANGNIDIRPNGTGTINLRGPVNTNGNVTAAYLIGDGSKLSGITAGTTYSDTNVAAYLTAQNISSANIGGSQTYANTQIQAISANIGSFYTYANATYSTGGGSSYGNTNVAAYLTGTITVGNIASTNGYFWANGTAYSTGGGSYGNTEVAAYLPTYTGDLNGPLRSGNVYSTTTATITGITGVFVASGAGANVTITGESYLDLTGVAGVVFNNTPRIDVHDGNLNVYKNTSTNANGYIYADNNIRAGGNVIAPNFTFANGVNILSTVSGSGTYGNTEVDAYLNGSTSVVKNNTGNMTLTGNTASLILSPTAVGGIGGPVVYAANSSNIGSQAGVYTTTGFFWANGVSYVNGDLAGNDLFDSTNGRILANAFPDSTGQITIPNNQTSKLYVNKPTYTAGVLQQPPLANATPGGTGIVGTSSQVIGLISSANIGFQSGYGFGAQNRDTIGSVFGLTVTPVTANSMAAQDRVRGALGSLDVVMTGQNWGVMSTAGQNQNTVSAINGASNFNGYGNLASIVGGTYGSFITPAAAQTANIQYATAVLGFLNLLTTAGTTGKANVVYSRGLTPFITGFSSNLTVQNAVGLHTYSGWAGSGAVGTANNPVIGRWAVLNEDANTAIQSNGNITFSNAGPVGSRFTVSSRFANIASTTNFTGNVNFTTAPTGLLGKNTLNYSDPSGYTIASNNLQATFTNSNIAQIGPVNATSTTYHITTTQIINGTQTTYASRNVSYSALTDIPSTVSMSNQGDTTVAVVCDATASRIYRVTWVKTGTPASGADPYGSIIIETLV